MRNKLTAGLVAGVFLILGTSTLAKADFLTFDGPDTIAAHASEVIFSGNASTWTWLGDTVEKDPDGGSYSYDSALQFGNAGGVLGTATFSSPQTLVSVWALSGPGPDTLSKNMYIKAFN